MDNTVTGVTRSGTEYYDVHIGFWINWSHGRVKGATFTLTRENGNLLIAFLAIFVSAAGRSVWRISCYILHHYLSSSNPQDGIYHQRQAILRNSDNANDAILKLISTLDAWRKRARRPYRRLIPVILMSLFISAAFSVSGLFSSRVTSDTANEVLLNGKSCRGISSRFNQNWREGQVIYYPWLTNKVGAYSNYALQCYTSAVNAEDCHQFVKPSISFKADRNASCPFQSKMCKTQDKNLILDTGYIDSNDDLGINMPSKDRFKFRVVHECAPIVTENFTQIHENEQDPKIPLVRYYYGTVINGNPNYTGFSYEIPVNFSGLNLDAYSFGVSDKPTYGLGIMYWFSGDGIDRTGTRFIPELVRTDADVSLYFLTARAIHYPEPVDDLWYSAHRPGAPLTDVHGNSTPSYVKDEPASVLGCTMQTQFCNPNHPGEPSCQPLRGFADSVSRFDEMWKDQEQVNVMNWTSNMIGDLFEIMTQILLESSDTPLTSKAGLNMGISPPLESDQWYREVEHWFSASLASLQGLFVDVAMGPGNASISKFAYEPWDDQARQVCRSQKIKSTRYSSFSVLGIAIILILGSVLVVIDTGLETMIFWWGRRRNRITYAHLEWKSNSMLQIQRLAHEGIGSGSWSRSLKVNPVTLRDEELAILDVSDIEHPRLRRASIPKVESPRPSAEEMKTPMDSSEATEPPASPTQLLAILQQEQQTSELRALQHAFDSRGQDDQKDFVDLQNVQCLSKQGKVSEGRMAPKVAPRFKSRQVD